MTLGSIAGLGVGIHDARARTRVQEVAERNEELRRIRDELQEALRRVEASNERLEHFAAVGSHDLREPLRMISSYLQLLETRHGDEDQLRQVFQNLLTNAIEHADGRPRVEVSAEASGDEWVISVQDEGTGIDHDDQERIFEVFERASLDDDGDGSGIGLALCRWIVERYGGEIWVDSEPGSGSTFSFTLPGVGQPSFREDRHQTRANPATYAR